MAGTILLMISCSDMTERIPKDRFIGKWELVGRSMFEGIEVEIYQEDGAMYGRIIKLNDNKYVKMFLEIDDTWISGITRGSNYEFAITEKRIGSPLFSIYGISTSDKYSVQFIDENTFALGDKGRDPLKSSIKYVRIE